MICSRRKSIYRRNLTCTFNSASSATTGQHLHSALHRIVLATGDSINLYIQYILKFTRVNSCTNKASYADNTSTSLFLYPFMHIRRFILIISIFMAVNRDGYRLSRRLFQFLSQSSDISLAARFEIE